MIQPITALTPRTSFKGADVNSVENPVNRKLERRLALVNAGGVSMVTGALTSLIARSYTAGWKQAGFMGLVVAAITMLFVAPRFLYKSGINSYTKQQEMDVFTREKEVQKKLLSDVNSAIDNRSEDLTNKLENYSKTVINTKKKIK